MARRGRKPLPKAVSASMAVAALPRCPPHLSDTARREWRRLAAPLHEIGVLTLADRAVLAAYCQAYGRWVEAEQNLSKSPTLFKTPSGYAQQSPWLTIANKQLELMARFMGELGLTPVARRRVEIDTVAGPEPITKIEFVTVYTDENGKRVEEAIPYAGTKRPESEVERISVKWQD